MSVSKIKSFLHWFKLWELCCSLWSPCILNELVVTFVCGRSPWSMPALLDVLVGALEGEGLCPPGWGSLPTGVGSLLAPDWALLPAIWLCVLYRYPFPFCHKGYADVPLALDYFSLSSFLLSFCHRVVYLSPFTRSVPRCILLSGYAYTQGISLLGKKAL